MRDSSIRFSGEVSTRRVCHTVLDTVSHGLGVENKYRHCERSEFTPEAIQLNVGQVCPTYKKYMFLLPQGEKVSEARMRVILDTPHPPFRHPLPQGARGITCPTRHAELAPTSINANKTDRIRIKFGITRLRVGVETPTYNLREVLSRMEKINTRHAELVSASYQLVVIRPVGQILNNLKITDKCPYFLRFQNDTLNTSLNKPFNLTWRANPC